MRKEEANDVEVRIIAHIKRPGCDHRPSTYSSKEKIYLFELI